MDKLKLKGILRLRFLYKGKLVHEYEDRNLIVNSGYLALFSGLGGIANKNIVKVQCGTNGTNPVVTDTTITNAVDLTINTFTPSSNNLIIKFQLGANDANGMTIAEFGLICADGTLFSRKSWQPFLKIADLSVEGTWTIKLA